MHRGVGRVKGSRSGQLGTDYQRVYSLRHGIYVLNKFNSIETCAALLCAVLCCAPPGQCCHARYNGYVTG
jgi:hypothetical protein